MAANDQFTLDEYLLHLYWKEPFFHRLLRSVHVTKTRDIPTAGVMVRNARLDMLWNPDFLAPLEKRMVVGLLQHESYHLAYGHCIRYKKPFVIWNWATDLSINTNIPYEDLPPGGLIPGRRFDPLHPDHF